MTKPTTTGETLDHQANSGMIAVRPPSSLSAIPLPSSLSRALSTLNPVRHRSDLVVAVERVLTRQGVSESSERGLGGICFAFLSIIKRFWLRSARAV